MENKVVIDTNLIYYLADIREDNPFNANELLNEIRRNCNELCVSELSLAEIIHKCDIRERKKVFEFIVKNKIKYVTFFIDNLLPTFDEISNKLDENEYHDNLLRKSIDYKVSLETSILLWYMMFSLWNVYYVVYENINKDFLNQLGPGALEIIFYEQKNLYQDCKKFISQYYLEQMSDSEASREIEKLLLKPILILGKKIINKDIDSLEYEKDDLNQLNEILNKNNIFLNCYKKYISGNVKIIDSYDKNKLKKAKKMFIETIKEPKDDLIRELKNDLPLIYDNIEEFPEPVADLFDNIFYKFFASKERIKKNDLIDIRYVYYFKNYFFMTFDGSLKSKIDEVIPGYKNKIDSIQNKQIIMKPTLHK